MSKILTYISVTVLSVISLGLFCSFCTRTAQYKGGAFVSYVYEELLGRSPSEEELEYYSDMLKSGRLTAVDVCHAVAFSQEGRITMAGNDRFPESLYRMVHGEDAPNYEASYYELLLHNGGASREKVFAMILKDDAFTEMCSEYNVNPGEVRERRTIDPNKPMVAITFDDGPSMYTKSIARKLYQYDQRATFFVVGTNAANYPRILAKEYALGFEIGNHTYNHEDLASKDKDGINQTIFDCNKYIVSAVGRGATVIRPPYGSYDDLVKETVNRPLIIWSVDTRDWSTRDALSNYDALMNTISDGDIILMHDIYYPTARGVYKALPKLIAQGYQFVTVSELAEFRGGMQNGETYFSFHP